MSKLNPHKVRNCFQEALNSSQKWRRDFLMKSDDWDKNDLCSSRFLHEVCMQLKHLPELRDYKPNFIQVLDERSGGRNTWKKPGEWLLDATWTSERSILGRTSNSIVQIHCAIECESNSGTNALYTDLSKLLVIHSPIKIFAAGLHQQALRYKHYMRERIEEAEYILNSSRIKGQEESTYWYYVFWPSPKNEYGVSIWDQFGPNDLYSHLNAIHLYHRARNSDRFQLIEE